MTGKRAPSLWVIDPSLGHSEDQGVSEIVDGWPGDARVFRPALRAGDGPEPATGYDTCAVVLMGSRASALDELAWLDRLVSWIDPILSGVVRLPLLGICFGHQLMAHRAGAAIGFLGEDRKKRVGVETSTLDGGTLLPGRHELRVVVSHREEVKQAPAGYRVVATRERIAIDGLEHRVLPLYSFQFHPEAREEFARHAGIDEACIDVRLRHDNRRLLQAFRQRVLDGSP